MPSDLEELVQFLGHSNVQIRRTAVKHLVGYSTSELPIWKRDDLAPVFDLKQLFQDGEDLATNALAILINLSDDVEVRENLIGDAAFRHNLLRRMTIQNADQYNVESMCMLLANLAKSDSIIELITRETRLPFNSPSDLEAIDKLLECFVKGVDGKISDYDYLSYTFADLSRHSEGRRLFLSPRKDDDDIVPLTKLTVFTEHKSTIRRRGVANTIKNSAFDIDSHARMLEDQSLGGIGLLPYILLPLMGNEDYSDEDTEGMLDELQLLSPDKEREKENDIIQTHLETLLLLTTTREAREKLRAVKVYPIIRELHLKVEDEGVREGCDRLVQVLMRDEQGERSASDSRVEEIDEDEQIVEVL